MGTGAKKHTQCWVVLSWVLPETEDSHVQMGEVCVTIPFTDVMTKWDPLNQTDFAQQRKRWLEVKTI